MSDHTTPEAEYAAAAAECRAKGIRESVLQYSAEHVERGNATIEAETRYLRQVVLADVESYGGEPTEREAVAAAFAPAVDQLADAADPESRARAELAKLQAKNSMRRSADLIAIDLLPHLAETFAFVRGEQPTAEGRAAIDQLADALTGWVPGFVELVGFEWRKLEEIADGDDSTCSVCGVELPGIGAHDVGKHEEHRQAERHEARMTKLRAERPELFADKPAATSGYDPDFADRLQNGAYDRD